MARPTIPSDEQRYFLERDVPTRMRIIRWLAEGKRQTWIAHQLDCSQNGISDFAKRHRARIDQVRANLENEFAGIEYTDKAMRLEAYRQTVSDCDREIDKMRRAGRIVNLDEEGSEVDSIEDKSDALARLERTRHRALRSIAEELGQLPSRMALVMESSTLRHEIVGIDPGKDL